MGFLAVLERTKEIEKDTDSFEEFINLPTEDQPVSDFFQSTLDDYDDFDKVAWAKGDGYRLPSFPIVEEKLEGLGEGMYLFAAESNVGKSAVMINMLFDACAHKPNKLFGIYYSLDDPKRDIIPRVISMNQLIPISASAKPKRYQNLIDAGEENASIYQEYLDKRKTGLDDLRSLNAQFKIVDSETIHSAEEMFDHMRQLQIYIKAMDPEANIIVAIDSIDDIRFRDKQFGSTTDRHAEIARTVKHWATTDLHIPIFGSRHLSKLKQNRRPTLDDLKDSNEYVYEASLVWLLYNDVSKNKQAAKIYTNEEGVEGKSPVIELDWAKNKVSSYKGRTYTYFSPEYSKCSECSQDVAKRFDALVYEA